MLDSVRTFNKMVDIYIVATGVVMFIWLLARKAGDHEKRRISLSWTPVPATIVKSEVKTVHSKEFVDEYLPCVVYKYSIDGKEYECDRIRIGVCWGSAASSVENVIRRYPVSAHVTAYVNPDNHNEAVLERD